MQVCLSEKPIGFVIWTIEQEPSRKALVVNAAAVEPVKGVDMTEVLWRFANDMAARHGAKALRFWTVRKGLVRKLRNRMAKTYVMEAEF